MEPQYVCQEAANFGPYYSQLCHKRVGSLWQAEWIFFLNFITPSPWLTLLLFLRKNRVNQVKWSQFIQNQVKLVYVCAVHIT
jgi:hypothetical protein